MYDCGLLSWRDGVRLPGGNLNCPKWGPPTYILPGTGNGTGLPHCANQLANQTTNVAVSVSRTNQLATRTANVAVSLSSTNYLANRTTNVAVSLSTTNNLANRTANVAVSLSSTNH
ncbi:hypothetical protein DPMN_187813 [Dreissena polymorpha]|uniref:Uncharacterized protein n=1 Tax=Dreissena polymorpha TaxID=45954 RepID=A0A9D4DPQ9_DREPO|nr:hypothetical protein DPMN_187813 [Dreissena polymorpha]